MGMAGRVEVDIVEARKGGGLFIFNDIYVAGYHTNSMVQWWCTCQ